MKVKLETVNLVSASGATVAEKAGNLDINAAMFGDSTESLAGKGKRFFVGKGILAMPRLQH